MDKKELKYYIQNGFDYINGRLKNGCTSDERDSLYKDYYKLENILYKDARYKLSMSDLVKLETRYRATGKRLEQKFGKIL